MAENKTTPKRIVVLGRERSGTKWLTNLIANHSDVACIQSHAHGGVLETNLWQKTDDMFGSFSVKENRQAFNAVFKQTTFFELTKFSDDFVDSCECEDSVDLLVKLLDRYASENDCGAWVQKANSLLAEKISNRIPDVKIVIICREPVQNLVSKSHMSGKKKDFLSTLKRLLGYVYAIKYERRFVRRNKALLVRFEDLKADKESTLRRVLEYLELDFQPEMLVDRFAKNTTFRKKERPKVGLVKEMLIRISSIVFSLIPLPLLRLIRGSWGSGKSQERRLVTGTFER